MRRTLLSLLVLTAVMVGVGAAGTPVAGDASTAAVTAGINLSTSAGAHLAPRLAATPRDVVRLLDPIESLLRTLSLVVVGLVMMLRVLDGARSVQRRADHARRGPPALL